MKTSRAVGAVTIGQSPRADLLEPLLARLPGEVDVVEVGALDGLTAESLPRRTPARGAPAGSYPLTTRLRDGTEVTLDEADLAPLVQAAIRRAEQSGAEVTLLLCAGGFAAATSHGPLVRPFEAAVERLRASRARRIAVVVPFEGQAASAARKWRTAGFDPVLFVGDPGSLVPGQPPAPSVPSGRAFDAVVLDYVGHAAATVQALRARSEVPVVDLGECGAEAAARHLDGHAGSERRGVS